MSKPIANLQLKPSPRTVWLLQVIAWTLALSVCVVGVIAWGSNYAWELWPLSPYLLFPVLGILAFSLMWSHYIMGSVRHALGLPSGTLSHYFRITSYAVLGLICLHPGLLIYQRFHDGFGLPPGSYESYVAPGLGWVTVLGTASLCVFLAFELRRKFGHRTWWHYISDASDVAMLAIVYHGLRLGSQLQHGWFRGVWFFYAVTLVIVLIDKYYRRFRHPGTA